jgi:serine/threonine-protein kinase
MSVTNNLRLVEELGEGGMGSVWIADHLGLDTKVAIKFIITELVRSHPQLVQRFKREAAAAAKIKSPHVVQVFDHGLTEDGTPYIAMELLEGEALEDRLDNHGPLNLAEAGLLISQVCQVLGKAHGMGIVHRDIKPANLFLIESAYDIFVKVLDFGIAKSTDAMKQVSVTSTGAMIGSPLYMSPEQFTSAKEVDGRADLWSLAVVAYHALTGQPSFRGETLGQVMMAVMTRQYEPPHVYRPDLPGPLAQWFDRAFAQDINARFQTADEFSSTFIRALERASGAGLAITSPESPAVKSPSPQVVAGVNPTVVGAPPPAVLGTDPGAVGTLQPASATYDPALTQGGQSKPPWLVLGLLVAMLIAGGVGAAVMLTGAGDEPAAAGDADTVATAEPSAEPQPETSTAAETSEPTASAEASADTSTASEEPTAQPETPVAAKPPPGRLPTPRPKPKPKPKPATTSPGEKVVDHGY